MQAQATQASLRWPSSKKRKKYTKYTTRAEYKTHHKSTSKTFDKSVKS